MEKKYLLETFCERTANLLLFVISIISATILTNDLNRLGMKIQSRAYK